MGNSFQNTQALFVIWPERKTTAHGNIEYIFEKTITILKLKPSCNYQNIVNKMNEDYFDLHSMK